MSCINDVRLVGRLAEDVSIRRGRNNMPIIRAKVETFRPVADGLTGKTRWLSQMHTVVCYKDLVPMLEKHGKKGRFVKILGELTYNGGRAEIAVGGTFGEFGMMNSVSHPGLPSEQEQAAEEPSKSASDKGQGRGPVNRSSTGSKRRFSDNNEFEGTGSPEPSWGSSNPSSGGSMGSEADEIPF